MDRDIPKKYRAMYNRRKKSRKAAIRSFCIECCGYSEVAVKECPDKGCPLYSFRLYGGGTNRGDMLTVPGDYEKWRQTILKRDGYKCHLCKIKDDLQAHHLIAISDNKNLIIDESNGITLCKRCHRLIHEGTLNIDNSSILNRGKDLRQAADRKEKCGLNQ